MRGWILSIMIVLLGIGLHGATPPTPVTDLADLNASQYQALLQKLERTKGEDPLQLSLQKALLNRLIAISQSRIPPAQDPLKRLLRAEPKSPDDFRQLFDSLLRDIRTRELLRKKVTHLEKDLAELRRDIQDPKKKHKNLQTLRLQSAYTYKVLQQTRQALESLDGTLRQFPGRLLSSLDRLRIDDGAIRQAIADADQRLSELQKARQELTLEEERLRILGDQGPRFRQVLKGIEGIRKAQDDLRIQEIEDLFLLFLHRLGQKDRSAFALRDRIVGMLEQAGESPETVREVDHLLLQLLRKRLGVAATLQSAAHQELQRTLEILWHQLNTPVFHLGKTPFSILKIALAFLLLTIGFLFGWLYKRAISRIDSHNITPSTKTLLGNLGYYLIVTVAFFATLHYLGISLTSLALVAGALSVGIGFGLQNIVSNFVSGIILMFERSIKIGDFIELDNGLRGYVSDIRMRSMTITTNSNIDIVVPNQQLIENRVVNWTMNDKIRRFEIPFGVAYGTRVEDVIRVVMEAVGHSGFQEIYTSDDRQTQVIMTGMGDSSVDFALLVWIKGPRTLRPKRTTSRFLTLIYTALNDAGIEIPFPQRDLHLRSADVTLPVRIVDGEEPEENRTAPEWKEAAPESDRPDPSKPNSNKSEPRQ